MESQVNKLQEALTLVAEVCDKHVDTASNHRKIAESLSLITKTLSELLREKIAAQKETKE